MVILRPDPYLDVRAGCECGQSEDSRHTSVVILFVVTLAAVAMPIARPVARLVAAGLGAPGVRVEIAFQLHSHCKCLVAMV